MGGITEQELKFLKKNPEKSSEFFRFKTRELTSEEKQNYLKELGEQTRQSGRGHDIEMAKIGYTWFQKLWPLVVGFLVVIFVFGFGVTGIFTIFKVITWYYWVGIIFLVLMWLKIK